MSNAVLALEFTARHVADQMITAVEGGVNHWLKDFRLEQGTSNERPDRYDEITEESGDAETADVFLQMIVFGEIVYG